MKITFAQTSNGMKAAQIKKFGGIEVIEVADIKKPKIEKGKVLVKVYASSINPVDKIIREGYMAKMMPNVVFPFTLGTDIAGVVSEVGLPAQAGEAVGDFVVGNKVYGQAIVLAGASGAFAEYALVSPGQIAKMPKNIDFNEAASSVLVGVSAVQALVEHMNLKVGQKILIHGGAGGIGTFAVQIAKSIGAFVTTTATGDGMDYVKKLGADEVIDYKSHTNTLENVGMIYDAVFDTVGGEAYTKSFKVLKKGGVVVSMIVPVDEKLAEQYGVTAIAQFTKTTTKNLDILTDFIENKGVKVYIDKIYALDRIKEAFEAKEKGGVLGKIVITINS